MDGGRSYRGDWLTFTWGRTFILVPDALVPMGVLGKQVCHLLTGKRITNPPKTHIDFHTLHIIYYSGSLVLLSCSHLSLQTRGIYCQTTDVNIHNDIRICK